MSKEIDWSKAPADAEFAGTCRGMQQQVFYKNVEEYSYDFIYPNAGPWDTNEGRPSCQPLIPRPSDNADWSGEGLPPVGTICEFRFSASDDWNVVEVKYMSEMTALLFHHGETGDAEGAYCPKSCVFRPIKTAEQIEVENKKQAIIQICLDAGSAELTPGQMAVAEKLYDAGYRKVSK